MGLKSGEKVVGMSILPPEIDCRLNGTDDGDDGNDGDGDDDDD